MAGKLHHVVKHSKGADSREVSHRLLHQLGREPRVSLQARKRHSNRIDKLRWQPPPGLAWEDLPDGTRLMQARGEGGGGSGRGMANCESIGEEGGRLS